MGATVSVIQEEIARPKDAADVVANGSGVDPVKVVRLRQLLFANFGEEGGSALDDDELSPALAREMNELLTACSADPGIARLAGNKVLRRTLKLQMGAEAPAGPDGERDTVTPKGRHSQEVSRTTSDSGVQEEPSFTVTSETSPPQREALVNIPIKASSIYGAPTDYNWPEGRAPLKVAGSDGAMVSFNAAMAANR